MIIVLCFRYLRSRDLILYDGALRFTFLDHFLAPTTGYKTRRLRHPMRTKANNERIHKRRALIEHWFSRLKNQFPIFHIWNRKLNELNVFFRSAAALVNIKSTFVTPLRYHTCSEADCFYCYNIRHFVV